MIYSDLDYAAYDMYVKAVENNKYDYLEYGSIGTDFIGHLDNFVEWHGRHYNNLRYYYDLAKIKLRKEKLQKLQSYEV